MTIGHDCWDVLATVGQHALFCAARRLSFTSSFPALSWLAMPGIQSCALGASWKACHAPSAPRSAIPRSFSAGAPWLPERVVHKIASGSACFAPCQAWHRAFCRCRPPDSVVHFCFELVGCFLGGPVTGKFVCNQTATPIVNVKQWMWACADDLTLHGVAVQPTPRGHRDVLSEMGLGITIDK